MTSTRRIEPHEFTDFIPGQFENLKGLPEILYKFELGGE